MLYKCCTAGHICVTISRVFIRLCVCDTSAHQHTANYIFPNYAIIH